MKSKLILSCEHASNAIPKEYVKLFLPYNKLLNSHNGYDIGAELLFEAFKSQIEVDYSIKGSYSRLLIELNRSLHNSKLFSTITKPLKSSIKAEITDNYYTPYRASIQDKIKENINRGYTVIHLSLHSFTPNLNGVKRIADIGILYNPVNSLEKDLCSAWKLNLKESLPKLTTKLNYPYLGKADGLTTYLRKRFPMNYLGIELEVKNDLIGTNSWEKTQSELIKSFKKSLINLENPINP